MCLVVSRYLGIFLNSPKSYQKFLMSSKLSCLIKGYAAAGLPALPGPGHPDAAEAAHVEEQLSVQSASTCAAAAYVCIF